MKITATIETLDNHEYSRVAAVNMLLDISTRADRGEQKGRVIYPFGVVGDFTVTDEVSA